MRCDKASYSISLVLNCPTAVCFKYWNISWFWMAFTEVIVVVIQVMAFYFVCTLNVGGRVAKCEYLCK